MVAPSEGLAGSAALVKLENVCVRYGSSEPAVKGASFEIRAGETVGLVGETGSGKSTIGRVILGLVPICEGRLVLGRNIGDVASGKGRLYRRRRYSGFQAVFQDPDSSLDPFRTVGNSLAEPLMATGQRGKKALGVKVDRALDEVGLPAGMSKRYPAELSGGQRQRVAIARAFIGNPSLIVCDEAVTALDVSVQAQILNLLIELRERRNIAYLFISHDLAVVRYVAERVLVLFDGVIMESGAADAVYSAPGHPYTCELVRATREPIGADTRGRGSEAGVIPLGGNGCRFRMRCKYVKEECASVTPELKVVSEGQEVRCIRAEELSASFAGGIDPSQRIYGGGFVEPQA